jgi:ATP-dependent Lhr-like helicase
VSVVYVAPIRALLNNQEPRLARYAGMVGRRAFVWHGDTPQSAKKGFIAEPADLLLTTPESLEVMLMSAKVPAARLFAGLQAVVIDEVHAFVGDDRGGHLSAVLERLSRFCGRDVQRVALSATVGNPADILRWAAGSSRRDGVVVDPGGAGKKAELALDYVATLPNAAKVIAALHPGKKRLVFVDSRRRVEALGQELRALGIDTYVTHSSLSMDERHQAERAFAERQDCVIVATSALELGIDIGDLDHVLQIDAPPTVAGFLQRMGRTGRRDHTVPNCTFLATDDDGLLRAAALLRLHGQGHVEPVPVPTRSAHLLAHQLMALTIQERGGVPVSDWWSWLSSATPFVDLTDDDRRELVDHMRAEDILFESAGRFSLGRRGEKLYGFRNFQDLYVVFSTPITLRVLFGNQEIGTIETMFAQQERTDSLTFILGARAWRAVDIDWKDATVRVEPIPDAKLARWQGKGELLHRDLCRAMREILVTDDIPAAWSERARARLREIRASYDLDPAAGLDLVPDSYGYRLYTFAGGKANNLLGRVLEARLGPRVTLDNLYIGFRDGAARSEAGIRAALVELRREQRPDRADALRLAESCARGRLTKFQPCLPARLESEFLASALTDPAAARDAIASSPPLPPGNADSG